MSRLMRLLWFVIGVLLLTVARPIFVPAKEPAEPQSQLKSLLARPVLAEGQPLAEVKKFCDRRIAEMPHPASWSSWQHEAERIRQSVLDNVVFRGVPPKWRDDSRRVEWLDTIAGGPGYHIKKLRYEALPGLWIPALLYEPEQLERTRAGRAQRQWSRQQRQSRALQTNPLHQSGQARHAGVEHGMARHGATARRWIRAQPHESARPVWHERAGCVLPRDGEGTRRARRSIRTPTSTEWRWRVYRAAAGKRFFSVRSIAA